MGGLELSLDQKLYLLKYYFTNLFRLESIILIFLTILIHLYLNKKFVNFKDQVFKLNIFFYFIIASIISPPIFFILSPKIVSIYHFLDILLFVIVFYLMLSVSFILYQVVDLKKKLKNNNYLKFILILFIFFLNFYIAKNKNIENSII